jgi:hypothetical protein
VVDRLVVAGRLAAARWPRGGASVWDPGVGVPHGVAARRGQQMIFMPNRVAEANAPRATSTAVAASCPLR